MGFDRGELSLYTGFSREVAPAFLDPESDVGRATSVRENNSAKDARKGGGKDRLTWGHLHLSFHSAFALRSRRLRRTHPRVLGPTCSSFASSFCQGAQHQASDGVSEECVRGDFGFGCVTYRHRTEDDSSNHGEILPGYGEGYD